MGKDGGAGIGGNNKDGALASTGNFYYPPSERHSGAITIHGGNVTATGHDGAGIGSSGRGKAADITIYNGTVTATGGSAGIGGGDGGRVTIYGGTVTATGGSAGIGGGDGGEVTIYGGTVEANGGYHGAGIGGGSGSDGGRVTIYGGAVTAKGGGNGAGIGGGGTDGGQPGSPGSPGGNGGRVTIYDGTVTATGSGNGAGIGGGGVTWPDPSATGGAGGTVTIYGGKVTATGSSGGIGGSPYNGSAGIGGGNYGNGGEVTIYGGTVTATGGINSAGIGGGNGGNGGEVTISGGTVTATGGTDAAGIGGGQFVNNQSNFSTGENGQAVIFATGGGNGSAIGDQTKKDNWSGVIFQGNEGQVYGTSITPTEDFTIPSGKTLTVPEGAELTIPEGVTLTNEGTIANNGTIINHGTIINKNEGTLTGEGKVDGNPVTYEVTGVSLSSETLALVVGDSETLTATITPDKAASAKVTWESSDPNVATVTDGVVTAVAPGTATITATAGGVSATCTVTVERPYVPPANPNYRIDVTTTEGGTVTKDPAAAKAGETVTLTPAPEEGYEVGEIIVTDRFGDAVAVTENADGTYTFTMPSGQVSVEVTFVEAAPEPLPFTDVNEGDWFHDAVQYAYENGLMDGVGDGQFSPNATTNRAMVVTILYRLAGEPAVSGDVAFTDVAAGQWYTDAVLWAAQKGIVNGISETEFSPSGDLTREQLATILYRYAEGMGYDVSASADLSGFPDAGDIQDYATEALSWAVAEGLLQGFEDDSLQPQSTATRAQIATILMRFCEGVAE